MSKRFKKQRRQRKGHFRQAFSLEERQPFWVERMERRRLLTTLYVDYDATGLNDGSDWTNAYNDLQSALSTATSSDEIWVAEGSYKPTSGANRTISFNLKDGVDIYGGFAGTETELGQRDWVNNVTILHGDIGTAGTSTDNSYHVVSASGVINATLDGFTVTAGYADGPWPLYYGGGMYNDNSSPTLTNIAFSDNYALYGGGLANLGSSPTLSNVSFVDNSSGDFGGGMFNGLSSSPIVSNATFVGNSAGSGGAMYNGTNCSPTLTNIMFSLNTAYYGGTVGNAGASSPTLSHVVFSENTATYGGGMRNHYSSPVLTSVVFTGNSASRGGGIYNGNESLSTLTNMTFTENSATLGGALYNSYSWSTLINVTFGGNSASSQGGGIYNYASSPTLTNAIFVANQAGGDGGVMYNGHESRPTLTNATFTENSATYGGALYNRTNQADWITTIHNSILWGNSASYGSQIYNSYWSNTVVTHSIVEGGWWGTGNLNLDPLFARTPSPGDDGTWGTADDDYGDLRLQTISPAIDAGDNTAVPPDVADLDGDGNTTEPTPLDLDLLPRFYDVGGVVDTGVGPAPIVDMGAYEVRNQAPIADANGPYTVEEGSAVLFDATGSSDPDGDPLEYRWDFDGDDVWDTGWSSDPVASYTWDDDYFGTVKVEVSDGQESDVASSTVTVTNATPVITEITNSSPECGGAGVGEIVSVTAAFTDMGTLDTHTALVNWGDGLENEALIDETDGSGTIFAEHTYAEGGIYEIVVTLVDDDTGSVETTTMTYLVGMGVQDGALNIVGTDANDRVVTRMTSQGLRVKTNFAGKQTFDPSTFDQVVVYLCEGNDKLLGTNTPIPIVAYGGGGRDRLKGGHADDILMGEAGDDFLRGYFGNDVLLGGVGRDAMLGQRDRDLLIGGEGADRMCGGLNDDLLVAGTTSYDDDLEALQVMITEWGSARTFSERVENLNNTAPGPHPNDPYYLIAVGADQTCFGDSDRDLLFGHGGDDWLIGDEFDLLNGGEELTIV